MEIRKKFVEHFTIQAQTCSARIYTLTGPVTVDFHCDNGNIETETFF